MLVQTTSIRVLILFLCCMLWQVPACYQVSRTSYLKVQYSHMYHTSNHVISGVIWEVREGRWEAVLNTRRCHFINFLVLFFRGICSRSFSFFLLYSVFFFLFRVFSLVDFLLSFSPFQCPWGCWRAYAVPVVPSLRPSHQTVLSTRRHPVGWHAIVLLSTPFIAL